MFANDETAVADGTAAVVLSSLLLLLLLLLTPMIAILLLFRLMVGVDGVVAVLFDAVVPTLDDVR